MMALPIKTFWLMNSNIERIEAQRDLRKLTVANAAQSQEGSENCRQRLIVEAGTIVKLEGGPQRGGRPYVHEERDEAGFAELKELSKLF